AARCRSPTRSARRTRWACTSRRSARRRCRSSGSPPRSARCSTCVPPRSSATWTCCAPSTRRRPRTGTSGASSSSSRGSARTASRTCSPSCEDARTAARAGRARAPGRDGGAWFDGVVSEPQDTPGEAVQDTLPGVTPPPAPRTPAPPASLQAAAELPVARLALDLSPAHLDRAFDYLVPATMADDARPGARVKVRFAGRDVDGYVLERVERSDHDGRLLPLRRVVSPEPVLAPAVARHARAEQAFLTATAATAAAGGAAAGETAPGTTGVDAGSVWAPYRAGAAFLAHVAGGGAPRAVWTALPGLAPPRPPAPGTTPQ